MRGRVRMHPSAHSPDIPLAEQFRRRFAEPQRLVRLQHGILVSGIGVGGTRMVAVRQDLPNRSRGRATLMPVHRA